MTSPDFDELLNVYVRFLPGGYLIYAEASRPAQASRHLCRHRGVLANDGAAVESQRVACQLRSGTDAGQDECIVAGLQAGARATHLATHGSVVPGPAEAAGKTGPRCGAGDVCAYRRATAGSIASGKGTSSAAGWLVCAVGALPGPVETVSGWE